MSDLGGIVQSYLARRKRAEGGEVEASADDMVDVARERLATQPARRILPDVGEALVPDGGEFSPGTRWGNKAADIGGKLASGMAHGIATLPRRAIENSQYALDSGNYDPAVPMEAALMTMGTGAVAGVPVKGGEAVLGAGPVRTKPEKGAIDAPAGTEARVDVGPGLAGAPGGGEGLRAAELQAERWAGDRAPLEGLPRAAQVVEGQPFIPGPVARAHDVADHYMAGRDFGAAAPEKYHPIDVEHARAIAKAFDEMPHAPNDPKVKAAYQALAEETLAQYNAIVERGGLKVTPVNAADYPYHGNPRAVVKDVADNNHMAFFKSSEGFGSSPVDLADQPMLRPSGIKVGDHEMLYNDLFRVVHDYFGHVKNGYGFRGAGEDNAWRSHAAMYSPEARRAMTTETRGQNSWLNYGPHGEFNRTANAADTIYAPQKIGLLPDWVMQDRAPVAAPAKPKGGPRYFEGEPTINAGVDAPPNRKVQTVADPHRMMFPGVYRNPKVIAEEAASRVGPENPAMKQLFGVTRGDLREMAQGRVGNEEPKLSLAPNARGSLSAQNIQTPRNTQRLTDILGEAGKHEGLRTADAWYIMDPVYKRLEQMFGPEEAVRRYKHLNTTTAMASPGADVLSEIHRGTAAHWLQSEGRFKDFIKYGGLTGDAKNSLRVPRDVRYIQGHPYHRTAQGDPMQKYFDAGSIQSDAPKVPLYAHASGVPETGFQTSGPVGDAHFSRGVGLSDTRKGPTDVQGSFSRPEYQTLQPWWQHDVAGKAGLESVPAQARLWTALGPQTGVESALGAPKLELLAQQIMKAARRLGVSPETARDLILSGKAGAGALTGAVIAPRFFRSEDEPMRATGGRVGYDDGGGVDDAVEATAGAPVFDPAKLKTAAPAFDPAKLAAAKPKQPKTIGDRISNMWENASPGGLPWMAKELVEGIKGSVDYSKRGAQRFDPPKEQTEADVFLQDRAQSDAVSSALRATQFLTPSAPKGTGGIFAAPMRDAAAAKLVSPEAQANRELADEFGFKLSRGQATKDLDQIRYEDMAARDAYGKEAQDKASGFFNKQYEDIQSGTQQVGQELARGEQPLGSPVNAGAALNREVADSAARSAQMRDEVIARAEQAAAARRGEVADRGRTLDEGINQGRPPIAPREAGEAVNTGVRGAAAQDKAYYQAKYEDVARQPGEFQEGTFQGVGSRIRNDLFHAEEPVEITENTRVANHAIQALDNWSQPNIMNAADPKAAFADPTSVVTLKNVDTFMKRLSGFYRQAERGSEDQRAVGRIMSEFGNQVESAMADGMFSGDPAVYGILREAKAAFARYQRTYKPQGADEVGNAMRRIVERNATPEETANMIIGSGQVGNAALPVKIANRLQEVLGADSPEYQAIRQAMWQKASQVRNKAGDIDAQASARSIEAFANSTLGRNTFPQERATMLQHAQGIRNLDRIIESMPETAAAESARSLYQEAFSGDSLSGSQRAVFRRMVNGTATPEETAQVMFNAIGSGNPGDAARALRAIMQIVGPESPVMGTVRQGVWQKLTQEPFGKDQKGQQKMVQAVSEFVNGKGGTIARALYSPEERRLMNRFADAVKLTIIPKYARTNSDTTPAMLAAIRKYAGVVGTALGSIFHGGMSGGAEGYALTKAVDFAGSKIGVFKDRKKLNDSLEDVLPKPGRQLPRVIVTGAPRVMPAMPNAAAKTISNALGNTDNPYAP